MYNPSPKAPRTPPAMTAEQDAVLGHMRTSGQSLCLIACAGAGKSTMVVEVMAQVMAEKPLSLVLVFNKVGACGVRRALPLLRVSHSAILTPYNLAPHRWQEAQKSLSAKLRTIDMRLQASTFHAVCYKYWRAYETIKPKHTSSKTKTILATLYPIDPESENKQVIKKIEPVAMHVADVVKLVKNEALGCPGNRAVTEESVRELQVTSPSWPLPGRARV
jgi:superfamily I DNA/RNA helicase